MLETSAFRDPAEDELRGLSDGGHGVDVGISGRLHTDEGEDEAEDEREQGLADVHVEQSRKDGARHDGAGGKTNSPPGGRDKVFGRGLGTPD